MAGLRLSIIAYTLLQAVASSLLAVAGERRVDAYYSVAVLIYFIATTLDPVLRGRGRLAALDAALLAGFLAVVIYRVYEVLHG